jgi:Family of unknown function (DUF6247)
MVAEPLPEYDPYDHDPEDPAEILRVLPAKHHQYFLGEYRQALLAARDVDHYRDLHKLLRRWRLQALAFSDPGFEKRLQAAREAARTGSTEGSVSFEEVLASRGYTR